MNTTLRDFIDSRETAIKEQIKALRAELAEIKLARQALNGGAQDLQTSPNNSSPTIKEMVRTILDAAPSGLTAHQILEKINSDYGKDIERTSLSPQLSRLKSDNEVFLDGDIGRRHQAADRAVRVAEQRARDRALFRRQQREELSRDRRR